MPLLINVEPLLPLIEGMREMTYSLLPWIPSLDTGFGYQTDSGSLKPPLDDLKPLFRW
jgi:hypothetical protein